MVMIATSMVESWLMMQPLVPASGLQAMVYKRLFRGLSARIEKPQSVTAVAVSRVLIIFNTIADLAILTVTT
jgi:hypothetical protein